MSDDIPQWALELARGPAGEALQILLDDHMPQDRAVGYVLAAVRNDLDPVEAAHHLVKLRKVARGTPAGPVRVQATVGNPSADIEVSG